MAKSQARVIDNEDSDSQTTAEAQRMADLNEAEGGDLYRAIDEARSTQGAEVILTRTMPADRAGFCDKIPVSEFDLSMVKSRYGAGTYRVRFNGPTGFLPGGGTIKVAPTPEPPPRASTDLGGFMEIMDKRERERSDKFNQLLIALIPTAGTVLTALLTRQTPQGPDIASLVTALKPAPGPTLGDLSTAMVNMRTLTAPEKNESTVDTVLRVFEAAQNLSGGEKSGGKGETNWIDVIRDLIQAAPAAIQPLLQAKMAAMQSTTVQQQNPAIAPNTMQQPTPANAAFAEKNIVENAGAPSPTGPDMKILIEPMAKAALAKIAGWAEKDRDPAIYADVLVDELPDNFASYIPYEKCMEYLNWPTWFDEVTKREPRLAAYHDWCDECRLAIIEIFKSFETETAPDAAPAAPVAPVAPESQGSES